VVTAQKRTERPEGRNAPRLCPRTTIYVFILCLLLCHLCCVIRYLPD
jgi:hypothetical protein